MSERVEFEMTPEDLDELLDACKPTMVIKIGDYINPGPQENANRAWAELGRKMGFHHMTVQPVREKGNRFFTAVPTTADPDASL